MSHNAAVRGVSNEHFYQTNSRSCSYKIFENPSVLHTRKVVVVIEPYGAEVDCPLQFVECMTNIKGER